MDLRAAILAAAPAAPEPAIAGLVDDTEALTRLGALQNARRVAHMIGQCAHESMGFTHDSENLFYSTASRIRAVWPSRFRSTKSAEPFARNPEALANKVYGGRMGNVDPGDGFRYRGRGWIQLTGRSNYTKFGKLIGVDLEADPARAASPKIAWLLAASYMNTRKRSGKTMFEWADQNDVETVTRAINGGTHGLADRRRLTVLALAALGEVEGDRSALTRGATGPAVLLLQRALASAGFSPGGQDGQFGPGTEAALKAFQLAEGLVGSAIADEATWSALDSITSSARRMRTSAATPVAVAPVPVPHEARPVEAPTAAPEDAPMPAPKPRRATLPEAAPLPTPKPHRAAPQSAPIPTPRPSQTGHVTLRSGDVGEPVALVQLLLLRAGYAVNARFGPSTEKAVRAFQADKGLQVDGIIGPDTWSALDPSDPSNGEPN